MLGHIYLIYLQQNPANFQTLIQYDLKLRPNFNLGAHVQYSIDHVSEHLQVHLKLSTP